MKVTTLPLAHSQSNNPTLSYSETLLLETASTKPISTQNLEGGPCQRSLDRKRLREPSSEVSSEREFHQRFNEAIGLEDGENARESIQTVYKKAKTIRGLQKFGLTLLPQGSLPRITVISRHAYVHFKQLGKGAQAAASLVAPVRLTGKSHGTPPRRVLKIARKPFTPQRKMLSQVGSPYKGSIDLPVESGQLINANPKQNRYAICEFSGGDLTKIDYSAENFEDVYGATMIPFCIDQLRSIARGALGLHKAGLVHRDIKGQNALFTVGGLGKTTDFDLLMAEKNAGEVHFVGQTPRYSPDYIWGDIAKQNTLYKVKEGGVTFDPPVSGDTEHIEKLIRMRSQKSGQSEGYLSLGHQSKASDVFGFGEMIQYDVIRRVILSLSQKYGIRNDFDKQLKPITSKENAYGKRFTSDEIRQFGQQYPDARVRYIFPNAAKMTPGYVLIYPSQKTSHESIMRGIKNLEDGVEGSSMLPMQKLDLFRRVLRDLEGLEDLANSLKTSDPSQTPSMQDVVSSLQKMQGK